MAAIVRSVADGIERGRAIIEAQCRVWVERDLRLARSSFPVSPGADQCDEEEEQDS